MMRAIMTLACVSMLACGGQKWESGPGDARLTADGWAWPCDFDNESWVGTKHFLIDLQHAPGLVERRPLPDAGTCAVWGSTFAKDDVLMGQDLTDVDGFMEWACWSI